MQEVGRAIERSLMAGKLEEAARTYEATAASLRRAAARYRDGSREALAAMAEGASWAGDAPSLRPGEDPQDTGDRAGTRRWDGEL